MDQQTRSRRVAAVKAADAINAIEGAPISGYARYLSLLWAREKITGKEMKSALMTYYRKMAMEERRHG